jgi:arylesterase/paraoxonase
MTPVICSILAASLLPLIATASGAELLARDCQAVSVTDQRTGTTLRGIEDVAIDVRAEIAYLSVYDRRAAQPALDGIYALPIAPLPPHPSTRAPARPMTGAFSAANEFRPHGIDLFVAPGGRRTLFVVNHGRNRNGQSFEEGHSVEIFDLGLGAFVHRGAMGTVRDPLIASPNDVAAAGPVQFYVTNDHGAGASLARTAEDLFRMRRGTVAHYDGAKPAGERLRVVADGLLYPNGIALSADHRTLYVASTRDGAVHIFDLQSKGTTKPREAPDRTIALGFGPDNLAWDRRGRLLVAGHPDLARFTIYALTGGFRIGVRSAPSEVARLDLAADPVRIEPLYRDEGGQISGASVAAAENGKLLIGSVYDDRIVVCKIGDGDG